MNKFWYMVGAVVGWVSVILLGAGFLLALFAAWLQGDE